MAVYYYTKEPFIYAQLNNALRTSNVSHLILYRFYIQDMFHQLRECMRQESNTRISTVYRGQESSTFEVADLIAAHQQKSLLVINSFFSTSRNRECAIGFFRNKGLTLFDSDRKPVLFEITIEKQSVSRYFPFADISQISSIADEKEVLFAPGQMFTINHYEILHQDELNIFFFQMTLHSEDDSNLTEVFETFQNIWTERMNDPLIHLGELLINNQQLDEAKELYLRLLSEELEPKKKLACYQALFKISMDKNDTPEAMRLFKKIAESNIGSEPLPIDLNSPINETDQHMIDTCTTSFIDLQSKLSLDQPLGDFVSYMQSDEHRHTLSQMLNQYYTFVMQVMKNGNYDLAIMYFETQLGFSTTLPAFECDPLLKAKYYMQLGHCYRELNLNDKAMKNYQLALEQKIRLPIKEYVEILIGIAKVSEATSNYQEALNRYTEVDEIYKKDETIGDADERSIVQGAIDRMTLFLMPANVPCEIS